jgi:hypothetical protein
MSAYMIFLSFDGLETRPFLGRPRSITREEKKEEGKPMEFLMCVLFRKKKVYVSVSIALFDRDHIGLVFS